MASAPKTALPGPALPSRAAVLWRTQIGRKAVMAGTGLVLAAYVVVHLLANLQLFAGPGVIDAYAKLLRVSPPLLWAARIVLLACAIAHVAAGIQLAWAARQARAVRYADYRPGASSPASRTMIWSGLLVLGFLVYHVLDLTLGVVNPDFREGEVFHNVVASLGRLAGGLAYVVAMLGLGFHLWHGLWSVFQSLGLVRQRGASAGIQRAAVAVAVLLAAGFAAIPVAVLVGLVK